MINYDLSAVQHFLGIEMKFYKNNLSPFRQALFLIRDLFFNTQ